MIDTGPISASSELLAEQEGELPAAPAQALEVMEERLRRLENAVAALQESRPNDQARSHATLSMPGAAPTGRSEPPPPDTMSDVRQRLLPLAVGLLHPPPVAALAPAFLVSGTPSRKQPWLLFDTIDELRLISRMFSDRRYRVGWITILVPLCVFFLMIGSSMIVGSIPVVGSILDKVVDLLLAFFVYKVLTREAHLYREAVAYFNR